MEKTERGLYESALLQLTLSFSLCPKTKCVFMHEKETDKVRVSVRQIGQKRGGGRNGGVGEIRTHDLLHPKQES